MGSKSFGLLLIAGGISIILERLGLITLGSIIRNYWPLLIMLYGLVNIVRERELTYYNGIITIIGLFLQLDRLAIISLDVWTLFFPIILVFIGIMQIKK